MHGLRDANAVADGATAAKAANDRSSRMTFDLETASSYLLRKVLKSSIMVSMVSISNGAVTMALLVEYQLRFGFVPGIGSVI